MVGEDRKSEKGSKKGRGEGKLQTDRCFLWSARKSKAQRGGEGEEEEEEEAATEERETGDRIKGM